MRLVWTLGLLVIASAAIASPASDHVRLEQSQCMQCHGAGLWDPVMTAPVVEGLRFEDDGDAVIIHMDILNDWEADIRIGAFARTGGDLALAEPATASNAAMSGSVPASVGDSEINMTIDMLDAAAVELTFSATSTPEVETAFHIRPAGSLREWTPVAEPLMLSIADLAAGGWGDWEGRLVIEGPHNQVDWSLDLETESLEHVGGFAFSEVIGPGETGTLSWTATTMGRTITERFTADLYTTVMYDHDPGVDDNEGWLIDLADFSIDLESGRPVAADDLRAPTTSTPGLALPLVGLALLALARRR